MGKGGGGEDEVGMRLIDLLQTAKVSSEDLHNGWTWKSIPIYLFTLFVFFVYFIICVNDLYNDLLSTSVQIFRAYDAQ